MHIYIYRGKKSNGLDSKFKLVWYVDGPQYFFLKLPGWFSRAAKIDNDWIRTNIREKNHFPKSIIMRTNSCWHWDQRCSEGQQGLLLVFSPFVLERQITISTLKNSGTKWLSGIRHSKGFSRKAHCLPHAKIKLTSSHSKEMCFFCLINFSKESMQLFQV